MVVQSILRSSMNHVNFIIKGLVSGLKRILSYWSLREVSFFIYEGERLPLDFPMVNEAEYKGKKVKLNDPKSGGPKKMVCLCP